MTQAPPIAAPAEFDPLAGLAADRKPMRIGYARVSTEEQKTHSQTDALKAAGCEVIYEEKRSGGSLARPVLAALLKSLKPGDVVVVYKLDRIARSLRDLLALQERIVGAGAEFKSLTETIETNSPAGRMIFQILGAFAEFERELIRERTRVGLHAAMERGSKPGQPRKMSPELEAEILDLWRSGRHSKTDLATRAGVNISSIKRAISRSGLTQKRAEDPKLKSRIKRGWLSGKYTQGQLAKRLNVSPARVKDGIKALGLPSTLWGVRAAIREREKAGTGGGSCVG